MLDLCPIRAVVEATSSQLILLLSRVVGELFLLGAGNFEVIPNSLSYTIPIVLATQLHQIDPSPVLSTCRCPLYKL